MNRMIATLMAVGLSIVNLAAQPVNFDGGRSENLAIKTIVSNLKASAQSIQDPAPQSSIIIPPPAGTIQHVDTQTMSHLLALAKRIAITVPAFPENIGRTYSHELLACSSPQGSFVFGDQTTGGRLAEITLRQDYTRSAEDEQKLKQFYSFNNSNAFRLDVDMLINFDGSQEEKSISITFPSGYTFPIYTDGTIIYDNPRQLNANVQAQLKKALAFWAKVPPEAITTDALYGNLLNKDFTCAP